MLTDSDPGSLNPLDEPTIEPITNEDNIQSSAPISEKTSKQEALPEEVKAAPSDLSAEFNLRCEIGKKWCVLDNNTALIEIDIGFHKKEAAVFDDLHTIMVLDRSQSMRGNRFKQAMFAAKQWIESLSSHDRVSLVIFDSNIQKYSSVTPEEALRILKGLE